MSGACSQHQKQPNQPNCWCINRSAFHVFAGCLVGAQAQQRNSITPAKPTVSTSSNPLLPNALFVPWDKITPEHVQPAVKQVLEEEGAALDLLEADLEAAGKDVTYERVFRPYAQIRYRLDATYGAMDNLQVRFGWM